MSYHVGDHVEFKHRTALGTGISSGQIIAMEASEVFIDAGVLQVVPEEAIVREVHPETVMD